MCDSMMGSVGSMGMSGVGWLLPTVFMLVLLTAAIGVAVLAATMRRPAIPAVAHGEARALAVAKERYARGEIDHAELDGILDTLLRAEGRGGPGRG